MATAFPHHHGHASIGSIPSTAVAKSAAKSKKPGTFAIFLHDLVEDVCQRPLQAARFAKHDMFREHINAMSISYFSLIVLLIVGSVFLLPALIPLLTQ